MLAPTVTLRIYWCSWLMANRAVREVTGRAAAAAAADLWRRSYAGYTSQRLRSECIDRLRSSKARFVDNPKPAVLLPREITKKVVFGVNIVSKSTGAEEGVDIATVWELAENLTQEI